MCSKNKSNVAAGNKLDVLAENKLDELAEHKKINIHLQCQFIFLLNNIETFFFMLNSIKYFLPMFLSNYKGSSY